MAKPKKRGDVIGLRLPLDLDERLRVRAETAGVPPSAYIEAVLTTKLGDDPQDKPEIEGVPFTQCRHPNRTVTAVGLGWCPDCGGRRDPVGNWRPA